MAGTNDPERDQAPLDDAETVQEVEEAVRTIEEGAATPKQTTQAAGGGSQSRPEGDTAPGNDAGDPA